MNRSISTINAAFAHSEFGARGQGIVWAVVSTGVEASHPHFKTFGNLMLPDGLSHWDFADARARARKLRADADVDIEALGKRLPAAVDNHGHGTGVAAIIA